MRKLLITAALASVGLTGAVVHADSFATLNEDAVIYTTYSGSTLTGTTVSPLQPGGYAARIGEYYSPGGEAYVIPFQLPTLPAGEVFVAADFRTQLFGESDDPTPANADLYGIGPRASATVLLHFRLLSGSNA